MSGPSSRATRREGMFRFPGQNPLTAPALIIDCRHTTFHYKAPPVGWIAGNPRHGERRRGEDDLLLARRARPGDDGIVPLRILGARLPVGRVPTKGAPLPLT